MNDPIIGGMYVRLEIHIDKESVPTDGFALGACICDLQREEWMLDSFGVTDDGGITAVMFRSWRVGVWRHGMVNKATAEGTDTKAPDP